jgi:hypothetical protein
MRHSVGYARQKAWSTHSQKCALGNHVLSKEGKGVGLEGKGAGLEVCHLEAKREGPSVLGVRSFAILEVK